jgi:hypothetical protein
MGPEEVIKKENKKKYIKRTNYWTILFIKNKK